MKIENNIGWTDETGNRVTGCTKVSPGCSRCYAAVGTRARVLRAQGIETWGAKGHRYPVKDFSAKVRRLNKLCVCDSCHESEPLIHLGAIHGQLRANGCVGKLRRIRLFADSNSDWLDDKWPIETLADLLKDIHDCPNVDFQLLTKRPENCMERLAKALARFWNTPNYQKEFDWLANWIEAQNPPAHVWLGVSVEDQPRADERIPKLLQIPAAVRFISVEPLLEKVDLKDWAAGCSVADPFEPGFDWVIVGGESGKDRRDCGVEAICDVARQCVAAGVSCFVKQASAFKPGQRGDLPDDIWALKQFPR